MNNNTQGESIVSTDAKPRTQLAGIVRDFRDGILDCTRFGNNPKGMCFAVCAPLQGYLYAACGLNTKLVQADFGFSNHVWLQMEDGSIIDPTADQFPDAKLPPVYIGELPQIYREWQNNTAASRC